MDQILTNKLLVFIVALIIAAAGGTSTTSRYDRTIDVETNQREISYQKARREQVPLLEFSSGFCSEYY